MNEQESLDRIAAHILSSVRAAPRRGSRHLADTLEVREYTPNAVTIGTVKIAGNVTVNFGREVRAPADCGTCHDDRMRRRSAIDGRLKRVPGGARRLAAYLEREFGGALLGDLLDAELERVYAYVCSMPTRPSAS